MAIYYRIKAFTFRDYRVLGELGSGVTGKVFLAQRSADPTLIALKLLHPDADALVRDLFFNEQRLLRKGNHRNVVQYVDGGSELHQAYLATRYVEGTRLDQLLGSPMPVPAVVRIIEQAAAAVDYLHLRHPDHPIMHCDVAPRNMVVDEQGSVVLLDLSSARTSFFAPADDASLLSPGYCAPEQLDHQPTVFSDQYALAVIACELLCGTRLYRKQRTAVQHDHPPIPKRVAMTMPHTVEVLLRALQRSPDARFPSCSAFAAQLERALRDDRLLDGVDPRVLLGHIASQHQRRRRGSARQYLALGCLVALGTSGLLVAGRPLTPPAIHSAVPNGATPFPPTATIAAREVIAVAQAPRAEQLPTATLRAMIVPMEHETESAVPTVAPTNVLTAVPTRTATTRPPATATQRPTASPTAKPPKAAPTPTVPPTPLPPTAAPLPTATGPTMPDLRRLGENQAKQLLGSLGISPTQIEVQYQSLSQLGALWDQVPAYVVVSTIPEPGTPLSSSTSIILGIRSPDDDAPPAEPLSSPVVANVQPVP